MKKSQLVLFICLIFQNSFAAAAFEAEKIYRGDTLRPSELSEISNNTLAGSVIIISEQHEFAPHQRHQLQLLQALRQKILPVVPALEFLSYPDQKWVDQFVSGKLSEEEFLQQIQWKNTADFSFYREQILFSKNTGLKTLALNAPRALTAQIARRGLESLSERQKSLLPPQFALGNADYMTRMWEAVGEQHFPREKLQNYFASQSVWDDTMAWQSAEYLRENPDSVVVIIVGDFHAIYGGGLPDRLRARGIEKLTVISQVNLSGLNEDERFSLIAPDARWGVRADYIWTAENPAQ